MRGREWVAPQWQPRLRAAGLSAVAELLEHSPQELALAGDWQLLSKPGLRGRERWRWELPDATEGPSVLFVKRYARCGLRAQWDRLWRQTIWHSRAWWEHEQCCRLAHAHIPGPQAAGAAERMAGLFERRGVVLLSEARGDGLDRAWVSACRQRAPITRGLARHDLVTRLARLVSAFHQAGTCHRDLYLCHMFVDLDLEGRRPPAFAIIDLARAFRPRLRRMRWIIKDLAQLDSSARQVGATRTDRLRFLHAYLGLQRGGLRIRWYARRVARKSDWICRRIERQSRST